MLKKTLLAVSISAPFMAQAQILDVDWLYLSGNNSWISRSETLIKQNDSVKLPVSDLSLDQFYWHAENPQTQLTWQTPNHEYLPAKGSSVEIAGKSGFWLVQAVNSSHLVLQQGKSVHYWPHSQWHELEWTSAQDFGLTLQVKQPTQEKNQLFYAWQTPEVSAEVTYRLEANTLYQEMFIANHSSETYRAGGYSFAQSQNRPAVAAMAMRSFGDSAESMVSSPKVGESEGIPTLYSDKPLRLDAGANIWLPVAQVELDSVERQYNLNWDSRQSGQQYAQTQLVLKANSLPDIPGQLKVGVFDQQLAIQKTYYQVSTSTEARLDLGQSALVSVSSTQARENLWRLTFSNRSKEKANIQVSLSHWDGKKSQRFPMTVRLNAETDKVIELELTATGLRQKK